MRARGLLLLFFLFTIGCVTTEDVGRLQWDINELRSEVEKLKEAAPSRSVTSKIEARIKAIEEKQNATSKTVSDLLIQIQSLTSDLQMLTGRFEEAKYFSEKTSTELIQSRDKMMAKINELEVALKELKAKLNTLEKQTSQLSLQMVQPETRISKRPEETEKPKPERPPVKELYMSAYQAFRNGDLAEAREKFQSVIRDYPPNEYTDNARFWIAETYYKEGKYEDAILAYEELLKKHPDSEKVPGAMLKQGLAFFAIKDKKTGTLILEKLIEKYPDSEPARLAAKKLRKKVIPKKKR